MRIPFATVLAALVLVSLPVHAQEPAKQQRHLAVKADDVNAICGVDRQCRLQYLRAKGLRTRRQRIAKDLAQKAIDDQRIERIRREAEPPRDSRPFGTDLFLSTSIVGNGGMVGGSFHKHLRVDVHAGFSST